MKQTKRSGWQKAQRTFPIQPCELCGETYFIHRHHKDGNTSNNISSNIQFLCPKHHVQIEKSRGIKYGISKKIILSKNDFYELYRSQGTWKNVSKYLGVDIRTVFNYKKQYA